MRRKRTAGFGERDFTPVGQTKGLVDRSIQSYYGPTDVMQGVELDSNPDHHLPMADGERTPRPQLASGRFADEQEFGGEVKPTAPRPALFAAASPLRIERAPAPRRTRRDHPDAVTGRVEGEFRGAWAALETERKQHDGDYTTDFDLSHFDFADPATDGGDDRY